LMQVANPSEKAQLTALLGKEVIEDGDVKTVIAMMGAHDVLPYTIAEARKYVEKAKSRLNGAANASGGAQLLRLADFVVERQW